jgi:uncharacterized protein (DUF885 family)
MAIVAALSSGGTFVLKEAATEAVKDAYNALKVWIQNRYPTAHVSVEQLEKQPASEARQAVVAEDLERAEASKDAELVKLAQTVVARIEQQGPDVARSIGVDVGKLNKANVTLGNVTVTGKGNTGVTMDDVSDSTLRIGDVSVSSESESSKKA